jgi:hypothetical protein
MSIGMKQQSGLKVSPPAKQPLDDKQLRRDRWTAIAVVMVTIALMALIVWLASVSGGTVHEGIDYWPMMP